MTAALIVVAFIAYLAGVVCVGRFIAGIERGQTDRRAASNVIIHPRHNHRQDGAA